MADPSRPIKTTRLQLLLECVQRELTYIPLAASALLVMAAPDWAPTWMLAPGLFIGGGTNFIYDLLMGKDVREALASRVEKREEAERDAQVHELKGSVPEGDAKAILAIRALEKATMDKIKGNAKALELTGTFSHVYVEMVRSVADSAISALRRKRSLLETASKLHELKAEEEANTLCEQIPALDDRVDQARGTLQEALTQLTLMESEHDSGQLTSLSGALTERLKMAEEIARDVSAANAEALGVGLPAAREPEFEPEDRPRDRSRGSESKKTTR